jgi:hypothetical protein
MRNFFYGNFWPMNQLKDCTVGNGIQRLKAYEYNQKNVNLLINPMLNWLLCIQINYLALIVFEEMSKSVINFIYLAAVSAIAMTFCFIGLVMLTVAYIFLRNINPELSNYLSKG